MYTENIHLPMFKGFYETYYYSTLDSNDSDNENIEDVNYNNLHKDTSKFLCKEVQGDINFSLDDREQIRIKFLKLESPAYYNYSTDKIDCRIYLTDKAMYKLINNTYKNKEKFIQYLKNNFTSYDGFISFYSNQFPAWVLLFKQLVNRDSEIKKDKHNIINVLLEFYLQIKYVESKTYKRYCNYATDNYSTNLMLESYDNFSEYEYIESIG